jgi:hypothetical protein
MKYNLPSLAQLAVAMLIVAGVDYDVIKISGKPKGHYYKPSPIYYYAPTGAHPAPLTAVLKGPNTRDGLVSRRKRISAAHLVLYIYNETFL